MQRGVSPILHYLDNFLTLGSPGTLMCPHNLQVIQGVRHQLGVLLALEKVEGPSKSLTFLGILLDTENMEARLPHDKLQCIRAQIATWLGRQKAKKREILSLVGLLQHATKVVKPGRTFIARMYKAAAKLKELHHVTRLTKEFKSDLQWWNLFAATWNGVSSIVETFRQDSVLCIQTDASGHWGCGARFDS